MIFPLQPLLDGWRANNRPGLTRLALLDVDGCVTVGEAAPLDFAILRALQDVNRRAAEDPTVPGLALCTGRPEPYVELLTQSIGGYLPAVWESGAGLYFPAEYRFRLNPAIDDRRLAAFEDARRLVAEALIHPRLAFPQPGKEASMTLYPSERSSVEEVFAIASRAVAPLAGLYWVQQGLTCVEVLPVGVHKGSGARWLLELLGLAPDQALGVGDSPGDVEIFHVVGLGATPANGHPAVKAAAAFVAPREFGQGLLDVLAWCVERNRAILA